DELTELNILDGLLGSCPCVCHFGLSVIGQILTESSAPQSDRPKRV
ncbi:MAG: hypothetical protein ACI89U_001437, partial [Gammaproteobacteria bacterium]